MSDEKGNFFDEGWKLHISVDIIISVYDEVSNYAYLLKWHCEDLLYDSWSHEPWVVGEVSNTRHSLYHVEQVLSLVRELMVITNIWMPLLYP